jgi:putative addiction module killer protein
LGDCESVGNGILEIRIHYAKGYRIYLKDVHGKIVILLNGGDKSKQQEDILKAKQIWKELKNSQK